MHTQTPKLRFPEFSDKWEVKKLGDLLEFKNGINADKEQYGSGAKFINVLDILNNDYITHDKIIGSVNVDNQTLEKYLVSYGDILFQRSSETREEVGTANVYLDETRTATFGGFVIRGKKIGEYNPVFLNKLLKTDSARDNITSKSGGSTRYNVGQEILSSVGLLFPQLPEQTKIANFLIAIDEKIQALKQKKTLLEQYKKGIMQQIFSQELRFKNDDGADFDDWEEKSLGEICKLQGGYAFKSNLFKRDGIPVIRISNISNHNNYIDFGNIVYYDKLTNADNFIIKKGDLIIAMSGATTGKSSIYNLDFDSYLNQRVGLFKSKTKELYYKYLIQFVFSESFNKQLETVLVAGAQPNVSSTDIESFFIPFPSLLEQQKIASFLTAIDEKIEKVSQQITATEKYKKGLLQQMFI
ncbi:restriction endonuclease subunit S [Emticicia sp.]|uniref:restriction endonuclease subunit S n=1 Tax=Emticicia sp. TaxID=1930953 RepID=UPI00375062A9